MTSGYDDFDRAQESFDNLEPDEDDPRYSGPFTDDDEEGSESEGPARS